MVENNKIVVSEQNHTNNLLTSQEGVAQERGEANYKANIVTGIRDVAQSKHQPIG